MEFTGISMIDINPDNIYKRLSCGLPGERAQKKMSPSVRYTNSKPPDPKYRKESGVLILLYPDGNDWATVLMERTVIGPHGGQVSFPGGKKERDDPTIEYTALREAKEEVGVRIEDVQILGSLTKLFVPNSNYLISPIIALATTKPIWIINPIEVKSLIPVKLKYLFDDTIKKTRIISRNGVEIEAPFYDVQGHFVWGATAMIISEFETLLR
jgi:8-oxo-dGTP pyrophosphatase MutT (NUDIX family)